MNFRTSSWTWWCALAVALVIGAPVGAASAAPPPGSTGSISGRVVDAHGTPLPGICVDVQNGPSTSTDSSGMFSVTGLAPGSYLVQYDDCIGRTYFGQWYFKADDAASATPVGVVAGNNTALQDAPLAEGATVSGTVSRTGTGAPLQGICVEATKERGGGFDTLGSTTTASDGTYSITRLPADVVHVRFHSCAYSGPDVEQWNGATDNQSDAPDITLTPGGVVSGTDAALQEGVGVTGTVTDGSSAIPGITVNINPQGSDGPSGWAVTDINGEYQTSALPPATYRVEFVDDTNSPPWATQFWSGKAIQSQATLLTIHLADAPQVHGIDAVLAPGATISGSVITPGGAPIAGLCVAVISSDNELLTLVGTDSGGAYTADGLPATTVRVSFVDCGDPRTHVQQWWSNATGPLDATPIVLATGEHRSGIDAVVQPSGLITGTVTGPAGTPIENVCVVAVTDLEVGDAARTDSGGHYTLAVAARGPYVVQFVDCNDTPIFAGQWFSGATAGSASRAGARSIAVANGQTVGGIDAHLVAGTLGSISGRVVNRHGVAMTNVCVIAYLPDNHVRVAAVQPDGTYTVADIPSGSYGLVFLDCSNTGGDPSNLIPDPEVPSTVYRGVWWGGATMMNGSGAGRFDPLQQHAVLIEVGAGANLAGYDQCYGCLSIKISSVTPRADSLTVAFDVVAPAVATAVRSTSTSSLMSGVEYTATCTSSNGGVTRSNTGPSSPIVVSGLTRGARYSCTVVGADMTSAIGRSTASPTIDLDIGDATTAAIPVAGAGAGAGSGAAPRELALTGTSTGPGLLAAGLFLSLGGLAFSFSAPRRRRPT